MKEKKRNHPFGRVKVYDPVYIAFQKHALDIGITVENLIERLMVEYLEKKGVGIE